MDDLDTSPVGWRGSPRAAPASLDTLAHSVLLASLVAAGLSLLWRLRCRHAHGLALRFAPGALPRPAVYASPEVLQTCGPRRYGLPGPVSGDSDVWARGTSETEAAAGGRLGSRRPAAYQGGGAERGGAPGLWGARVVTALLRRFLARGRGCAQGTAGAAELRPAGAEAAGDARRGWASAAAAAAAAEAAHAGGTQAALTRLQATPEFARWRARRGWAAADVARANRCVALLKELRALDPACVLHGIGAWPAAYEARPPPRLLAAAEALANAAAGAALAAAALAWRGRPPGGAAAAWPAAAAAAAGLHFGACLLRGRSPAAAAAGLWWEDAAGRGAAGAAVLAAAALDAGYAVATCGLGAAVTLALRCLGGRSLGERALGIALVREVVVSEVVVSGAAT